MYLYGLFFTFRSLLFFTLIKPKPNAANKMNRPAEASEIVFLSG